MTQVYLSDGVTEQPSLNAELTAIESDLIDAVRLAIARLRLLVDQEPASSHVVDTRLSDLHNQVARYRNAAAKRIEITDILTCVNTDSGTPELPTGWTLMEALRGQDGGPK